mgnify:CR=1 FL=1
MCSGTWTSSKCAIGHGDCDNDGELTQHEIFKAIVLDEYVQSLLQMSPCVWDLLAPLKFHSSWHLIDEDQSNSVTKKEFIGFAMKAETFDGDDNLSSSSHKNNREPSATTTGEMTIDLDQALVHSQKMWPTKDHDIMTLMSYLQLKQFLDLAFLY